MFAIEVSIPGRNVPALTAYVPPHASQKEAARIGAEACLEVAQRFGYSAYALDMRARRLLPRGYVLDRAA